MVFHVVHSVSSSWTIVELSSWITGKYVHLGGLVLGDLNAYSQPIGIDWDGRNCNYFVGANAHIWMWLFQRLRFGWWSFLFIWWKQKSDYQALLWLTSNVGKCKYSKEFRGKEFHVGWSWDHLWNRGPILGTGLTIVPHENKWLVKLWFYLSTPSRLFPWALF